jgi:hypothetical protein
MPPGVPPPCRLILLTLLWKFTLAPPRAPTPITTQDTSNREGGNCGRKMTGNIVDKWRLPRHV